jgi:hypothetical protein
MRLRWPWFVPLFMLTLTVVPFVLPEPFDFASRVVSLLFWLSWTWFSLGQLRRIREYERALRQAREFSGEVAWRTGKAGEERPSWADAS